MSALTSLVGEGRYLDNEIIRQAVPTAIWETLAMTGVASASSSPTSRRWSVRSATP